MDEWVICYEKKNNFPCPQRKDTPCRPPKKQNKTKINFNKYLNFILNNIVLTRITTLSLRKGT